METIFGRTKENWYLEELEQDQKVEFDTGSIKGTGTICGISGNGVPIAGRSYIIKLDTKIENFKYSHISLPEILIRTIELI